MRTRMKITKYQVVDVCSSEGFRDHLRGAKNILAAELRDWRDELDLEKKTVVF